MRYGCPSLVVVQVPPPIDHSLIWFGLPRTRFQSAGRVRNAAATARWWSWLNVLRVESSGCDQRLASSDCSDLGVCHAATDEVRSVNSNSQNSTLSSTWRVVSITRRIAPYRKRFPFGKNVAKKSRRRKSLRQPAIRIVPAELRCGALRKLYEMMEILSSSREYRSFVVVHLLDWYEMAHIE